MTSEPARNVRAGGVFSCCADVRTNIILSPRRHNVRWYVIISYAGGFRFAFRAGFPPGYSSGRNSRRHAVTTTVTRHAYTTTQTIPTGARFYYVDVRGEIRNVRVCVCGEEGGTFK